MMSGMVTSGFWLVLLVVLIRTWNMVHVFLTLSCLFLHGVDTAITFSHLFTIFLSMVIHITGKKKVVTR